MARWRITKLETAAVACLPLFSYWVWPIAAGRPVKLKAMGGYQGTGCGLPSQHASGVSVRYGFAGGVPFHTAAQIEKEAITLGFKPVANGQWVRPQGAWPVQGRRWISISKWGVITGSYYSKWPFGK